MPKPKVERIGSMPLFLHGFTPAINVVPALYSGWSAGIGVLHKGWNTVAGGIHTVTALAAKGMHLGWTTVGNGFSEVHRLFDENVLGNLRSAPLLLKVPFHLLSKVLGWLVLLFSATGYLWVSLYATVMVWVFLGLLMWPMLVLEDSPNEAVIVLHTLFEIIKWLWNITAGVYNVCVEIARPFMPEWNVVMEMIVRLVTLIVEVFSKLVGGLGDIASSMHMPGDVNDKEGRRGDAAKDAAEAAKSAGLLSGNDEDFVGFATRLEPRYIIDNAGDLEEAYNKVEESVLAPALRLLTIILNVYARILWLICNILLIALEFVLDFLLKVILLLIDAIIYIVKYMVCMSASFGCALLDFIQDIINLGIDWLNLYTWAPRQICIPMCIFDWLLIPPLTGLGCSFATLQEDCIDCKCSAAYGMTFSNLPPCQECYFTCANRQGGYGHMNWVEECPSNCPDAGPTRIIEPGWCSAPQPAGMGGPPPGGRRLQEQDLFEVMLSMTQSDCYYTCLNGLRSQHCRDTDFAPLAAGSCFTTLEVDAAFISKRKFFHRNHPSHRDLSAEYQTAKHKAMSQTADEWECPTILGHYNDTSVTHNAEDLYYYQQCINKYAFQPPVMDFTSFHRHLDSLRDWSSDMHRLQHKRKYQEMQGKLSQHMQHTYALVEGIGGEVSRTLSLHLETYQNGSRLDHVAQLLNRRRLLAVWGEFTRAQDAVPANSLLVQHLRLRDRALAFARKSLSVHLAPRSFLGKGIFKTGGVKDLAENGPYADPPGDTCSNKNSEGVYAPCTTDEDCIFTTGMGRCRQREINRKWENGCPCRLERVFGKKQKRCAFKCWDGSCAPDRDGNVGTARDCPTSSLCANDDDVGKNCGDQDACKTVDGNWDGSSCVVELRGCSTDADCTRTGCDGVEYTGECQIYDPDDLFGYGSLWMFMGKLLSMLVTFRVEDLFGLLFNCWKERPTSANPYAGDLAEGGLDKIEQNVGGVINQAEDDADGEEQDGYIFCFPQLNPAANYNLPYIFFDLEEWVTSVCTDVEDVAVCACPDYDPNVLVWSKKWFWVIPYFIKARAWNALYSLQFILTHYITEGTLLDRAWTGFFELVFPHMFPAWISRFFGDQGNTDNIEWRWVCVVLHLGSLLWVIFWMYFGTLFFRCFWKLFVTVWKDLSYGWIWFWNECIIPAAERHRKKPIRWNPSDVNQHEECNQHVRDPTMPCGAIDLEQTNQFGSLANPEGSTEENEFRRRSILAGIEPIESRVVPLGLVRRQHNR